MKKAKHIVERGTVIFSSPGDAKSTVVRSPKQRKIASPYVTEDGFEGP